MQGLLVARTVSCRIMSSSLATPSAAPATSKGERVILIAVAAVTLPYVPRNTEEATEWYNTRVRSNVIRPTRSDAAADTGADGAAGAECGGRSRTPAAAATPAAVTGGGGGCVAAAAAYFGLVPSFVRG